MITAEQKHQDYIDDSVATGIALGEARGWALGEVSGERKAWIGTAKTALDLGMTPAQVAAITGLTIDEVTELQSSLSSAI